jgi:hypothetical protein
MNPDVKIRKLYFFCIKVHCTMLIIFLTLCSGDSVTIYDGGSYESLMIGEFCGDSIPQRQLSSGNEIFIHFVTGFGGTRKGFQLEYASLGNDFDT